MNIQTAILAAADAINAAKDADDAAANQPATVARILTAAAYERALTARDRVIMVACDDDGSHKAILDALFTEASAAVTRAALAEDRIDAAFAVGNRVKVLLEGREDGPTAIGAVRSIDQYNAAIDLDGHGKHVAPVAFLRHLAV